MKVAMMVVGHKRHWHVNYGCLLNVRTIMPSDADFPVAAAMQIRVMHFGWSRPAVARLGRCAEPPNVET